MLMEIMGVNFAVGGERTRPASVKMAIRAEVGRGLVFIWLTRAGARVENWIESRFSQGGKEGGRK